MLGKREGTPSCLKLFDSFVKYFFPFKEWTDTGFSIGRYNQKASLEGKKEHRAMERKSIGRRKGKASLEGKGG